MRLTLCGTPLYLAPEMVAQISYDESVDIWAIGVITYELLTEESPFKITQLRDLSKIVPPALSRSMRILN
jgi:serine/threonine protein kinase